MDEKEQSCTSSPLAHKASVNTLAPVKFLFSLKVVGQHTHADVRT